jgi:hypothetical protein
MAATIDQLPEAQRKKVVDALLAGTALRKVAVLAGVSHTQVAAYKRKVILPALQTARKVQDLNRVSGDVVGDTRNAIALTQAVIQADPFIARAKALEEDRARIKAKAEEKEDLRAWSSLDKNDLSNLELHARLAGRLNDTPQTQVAIQIVCPAGMPTAETPISETLGPVIEIGVGK